MFLIVLPRFVLFYCLFRYAVTTVYHPRYLPDYVTCTTFIPLPPRCAVAPVTPALITTVLPLPTPATVYHSLFYRRYRFVLPFAFRSLRYRFTCVLPHTCTRFCLPAALMQLPPFRYRLRSRLQRSLFVACSYPVSVLPYVTYHAFVTPVHTTVFYLLLRLLRLPITV